MTDDITPDPNETTDLSGQIQDFDHYLEVDAPTRFKLWGRVWVVHPVAQRTVADPDTKPNKIAAARERVAKTGLAAAAAINALGEVQERYRADIGDAKVGKQLDAALALQNKRVNERRDAVVAFIGLVVDDPAEWARLAEEQDPLPITTAMSILGVTIDGLDATRPFT